MVLSPSDQRKVMGVNGMKKIGVLALLTVMVFVVPAHALLMSNTDAWQYNNISTIAAPSLHRDSNALNMFGYSSSNTESVNTIFGDTYSKGYSHTVTWTTNAPVTIGSFNLVAGHDFGGTEYRDQNYRGFSAFRLEYLDASNNWLVLYSVSGIGTTAVLGDEKSHPVYGGGANYPGLSEYELYATIAPTTAQTWRISFDQFGEPNGHASGPRIKELDGFTFQPVPEPTTMLLLGFGLIGLAGVRRFRK